MVPSFVPFDRLIRKLSRRQDLSKDVHTLTLRVRHRLWYTLFSAHSRLLEQLPGLQTLSFSPPPFNLSIPHGNCALTSLRLDFTHGRGHYDRGNWLQAGLPLQIIARHLRLPKLRKFQVETVFFTPEFS